MEIEKHLAELAQADPQTRRTALENALTAEGLTPEIQECEADERRKAARNYLLYTADKDAKGPLFCAHYDAHPGSTGANDNAAAVCILIALLALGIRNIRLGPTLPAFLSPGVVQELQRRYDLKAITTPEEDLRAILGR